MNPKVEDSVLLDASAKIGDGTRVWHFAQIRDGVTIGSSCVIGRNVYIGSGVQIGDNCKIQNNALVYEPASISDGVFIGPGVILTNDQYPRAVNPDLTLKSAADWISVGVSIGNGASIGAGSVCVAPLEIGAWALVAAGSVVTKNVQTFALVAGVPARQIGWVGKSGYKLQPHNGFFRCPKTGDLYELAGHELREVSAQ
jgi:UDP-2-acetamido-3-amino-2,3-dideoxy-glucuronate N-acetyltransferase